MFIENRKLGLNSAQLKYIAIAAMFIDHTAHLFVPMGTVAYQLMRLIGRTTAPIMCFFITEGYHHTRNLKKYFIRMIIFAFVSHFAFAFCFRGNFFTPGTESVIATLTLCLLSVHVFNSEKIEQAFKFPIIVIIAYFADMCDWGVDAIIFTMSFELARGNRKNQLIAYTMAAAYSRILPYIAAGIRNADYFYSFSKLGVLLPIPFLLLYNGERGGGKNTKWVFYIFYPAHLLLLGYIAYSA